MYLNFVHVSKSQHTLSGYCLTPLPYIMHISISAYLYTERNKKYKTGEKSFSQSLNQPTIIY